MRWLVLACLALSCSAGWPRPERPSQWTEALRACRNGESGACYWAGYSLRSTDPKAAVEAYQRACDARVGAACNELGFYAQSGQELPQSGQAAMDYWTRSCAYGSDDGCDSLGTGWRDGVGGQKNVLEAAKAHALACEQHDEAGCTNLGLALMRGEGVEKNPARALELWARVCGGVDEAIYRSCRYLGDALVRGEAGVPKEPARGLRLLRRACRFGDATDCYVASLAMAEYGDSIEALRYLRTSCAWGHAEGCARLARTLSEKPTPEALEEAASAASAACRAGVTTACVDAGVPSPAPAE